MTAKKTGKKGFETEELLRSYFLTAGFFVVRGILLKHGGETLTDVDLWVYERSTTLARRRTVIDVKDNQEPKAAERLYFIKGLAEILKVEGAGVATSDGRPALRDLAHRNGVLWLDNKDLQRLKASQRLLSPQRITDEALKQMIAAADRGRASKVFCDTYESIKASVADRFGPACANTALDGFSIFAKLAIEAHPNSDAAILAGRLTYFSLAIVAAALDFYSAETALRPYADRLANMTDAIRFGDNVKSTTEQMRWTEAAIREFGPEGGGLATMVRERFESALRAVPAEGLAEVVVKMEPNGKLFEAAKIFESAAYSNPVPAFDDFHLDARSFLGAALDFIGMQRLTFAKAWGPSQNLDKTIDSTKQTSTAESGDATGTKINQKGTTNHTEVQQGVLEKTNSDVLL